MMEKPNAGTVTRESIDSHIHVLYLKQQLKCLQDLCREYRENTSLGTVVRNIESQLKEYQEQKTKRK